MKSYDLAIIGSGPGGYVAALYASRKKLRVCVIERSLLGGTCLNCGCIPTKSLLHSASLIRSMKSGSSFGVSAEGCHIDFHKMMARKNEVVARLRTGIETLFRANNVHLITGTAKITGPNTLTVNDTETIEAKNIIIAAGSKAIETNGLETDHINILTSDDVLKLSEIPGSFCVIGGGVIGCEFADLFNALGSKVTIVELTERLVPMQSHEASKKLELAFKKRGIDLYLSAKVESIENGQMPVLRLSDGKSITTEKVLVSVGRIADTEGLGLDAAGIKSEKGRIVVDEDLRTTAPGIYAIGDCVVGPQLAHKASYDAIVACDNILGEERKADYSLMPSTIWTDPEIASVGLSEDAAKLRLPDVKVAKFPYLASGKAFLLDRTDGFIKIIGNSAGDILGVEIFGEGACELIGEAVLAKTSGIKIKDWARSVHAHPTLSEIIQEAAHIFCGTGIHTV